MLPSDLPLDAQLRDVIVPPDLAARIMSALMPSDEQVDAALCQVHVPQSIVARLREIPADAWLDEALVDVPAPLTLAPTLRLTRPLDRLRRLGRQAARLALAASWFVALSAVLGGSIAGWLRSTYPPPAADSALVVMYRGPLTVDAQLGDPPSPAIPVAMAVTPVEAIEGGAPSNPHSVRPAGLSIGEPEVARDAPPGAVAQWVSLVRGGFRPLDDAVLLRFGVLGSPQYADDRLPEIEMPLMPVSRGIEPPLARGYDRQFFQKHRVFPPISPAADPKLASLAVPLVAESDVLERLARSLAEGREPPAAELRVEDFLAAMNYRLAPAPAGSAAIRTAAGPSPFGPPGTGLVQIGVQTGGLAARPQPSTHLVLAIDLSHSMSWSGRLAQIQQGIDRLLDQLAAGDRLSLVVFHEQVIHQVELATRDDAPAIRSLLASLVPRGGTNLAAGLQQAVSLAMLDGLPPGSAKRLVLITDSQTDLPPATLDQFRSLLVDAREAGVQLDVLDLSDRDEVDPVLLDWAQNLDGDIRAIHGARQLAWSLVEALTGGSPVVATDAKLTLHFNPQAVAAYRLIGHEANPLADLSPVAVEADLAAGESATALVELWFHPGEDDNIGQAELTWRDAEGQPHRASQRISRLQFAPTPSESAISLQQAALAAEVGQILRGSRDALREIGLKPANSRGLDGVLAAAARSHPQLRDRPDLQRLLALARQWERVHEK